MSLVPTLIVIRERGPLEILDLAVILCRKHPGTILWGAALGILPFAVADYVWLRSQHMVGYEWTTLFLPLFLAFVQAPLATAPLTAVLGQLMFGKTPLFREVAYSVLSRTVALIWYLLVIRTIFIVLVFTIPLLYTQYMFLTEVIVLERGALGKVFARSAMISKLRQTDLVARVLILLLLLVCFWICGVMFRHLFNSALWGDISWTLAPGEGSSVMDHWWIFVLIWIGVGFAGVVRFLTYIDQRTRGEGWELELRMKLLADQVPPAEES